MRSRKGSHRIVVREVEYRWRATGDDGYIVVGIWPSNDLGPYIECNFKYYETWVANGDGSFTSRGDQIVVTNRIVRRIIDHAVTEHGYDPSAKGPVLKLKSLDGVIELQDAIRASKRRG